MQQRSDAKGLLRPVGHGTPIKNDTQSAVVNMRIIDAIFRSAESERWDAL